MPIRILQCVIQPSCWPYMEAYSLTLVLIAWLPPALVSAWQDFFNSFTASLPNDYCWEIGLNLLFLRANRSYHKPLHSWCYCPFPHTHIYQLHRTSCFGTYCGYRHPLHPRSYTVKKTNWNSVNIHWCVRVKVTFHSNLSKRLLSL